MQNLREFFADAAARYSEDPLFNGVITYTEIWRKTLSRVAFLEAQGIRKGEVVGILAVNSPEWCMSMMAITSIGAIALLLDTNLTEDHYQRMLKHAGCNKVFISNGFSFNLPGITFFPIERPNDERPTTNDNYTSSLPATDVQLNDPAALFFTSGTTGDPKIVMLTHRTLIDTIKSAVKALPVYRGMNVLALLPMYHIYGLLANFFVCFAAGCRMYLQTSLKGPDIVETLKKTDCHAIPAVPQLWELFFDSIVEKLKAQSHLKYRFFMAMLVLAPGLKKIGLGFIPKKVFQPIKDVFGKNMKFFVSGGAALKQKYFDAYSAMGFSMIIGYGLTETTGPVCVTRVGDRLLPGAVGKPIEGDEMKIKDPNADGNGEIWVRGISVMPGYYNNPAANAEVFDAEGWFNTGDVGFIDRNGDLHITGRTKNIIVLDSGKNVYPEELEDHYMRSDQIKEISVFGQKINGRETVCAVIVPHQKDAGSYQRIKELVQVMNKDLPSYKIINQFALSFDPLPRNSTKKIVVREVIRLLHEGKYQSDTTGAAAAVELTPRNGREEAVIKVLQARFGKVTLYPHMIMPDLGIDSLKLIELVVHLEHTLGIAIDPDKFTAAKDLGELVAYLASCPQRTELLTGSDLLSQRTNIKVFCFYNPVVELLIWLVRLIMNVCWKVRAEHLERLALPNVIITPNHQSFLDIVWIWCSLPWRVRKNIYMLGKAELKFLSWILWGVPIIFVEREGNFISSLQAGAEVLKKGKSLIVFPEGTRSFTGKLEEFKIGAAYLATQLKKQIVPVTINGAYDIYPRQKLFPSFVTSYTGSITIHDPIQPRGDDTVESLTMKIRDVIQAALK